MASGIHCDGPACENWIKSSQADDAGFITVFGGIYAINPTFVAHFCSWDCLLKYAQFNQMMQ